MKIKSKIILALGLFGLSVPLLAEDPLEYWLADTAPFWNWDGPSFMREASDLGFSWTSENQSARAAPLKAQLFGADVLEAVVRFEDGSPHSFMASYFNRGDAGGDLSEADFQKQVRELIATISSTIRVHPRPGNRTSSRNTVRDDSRIWQRERIQFELSYSYTTSGGFRPEYIRLVAREFAATDIPSHARDRVNPYEIKQNITRDATTGDVWIANIPMVDQGPKGYCAAATSERILRFFGQEVDQHEIAQVANTTSGGGTSTQELKKALQAVGRQYGFRFKSLVEWDFKDFREEMADYNKLASRRGTQRVDLPVGGTWYIAQLYQSVDPDTWKELKQDQRSDFKKFKEKIGQYVDGGCPLAWSVSLGIYTDTWGRGHEKKHMPMDQAFAITRSLFSLEPKGLRL